MNAYLFDIFNLPNLSSLVAIPQMPMPRCQITWGKGAAVEALIRHGHGKSGIFDSSRATRWMLQWNDWHALLRPGTVVVIAALPVAGVGRQPIMVHELEYLALWTMPT